MPRTKPSKKNNGEASVTPGTVTPTPETTTSAAGVTNMEPAKKPTIVASKPRIDGRANLVPINVEDEVRRLAYLLSERRGFQPGHETEDWLSAEREIRERYHQQSA
ncbi:MAG TPA: DUF2934 domain-containing protein [Candidatus Sulfotelmatobacter sp.]|nr:DUF2934 domain-containing protein [Candidatus Sulfotelmatobacter sp.]